MKLGTAHSNPSTTLLVAADFGPTLDLDAVEKVNCSTNNHAAACATRAIRGWEECEHDEIDNEGSALTKKKIVSKCDRWVGFVGAMSKGKKMIAFPIMPSWTASYHGMSKVVRSILTN